MVKRKSKADKSFYIKVGVIGAVLVSLIVVGLVFLNKWEEDTGRFPEQEFGDSTIQFNGKEYVPNEDIETFLVMGLDKFGEDVVVDSYNNDKQADFIMLFIFDNAKKQCTAIQINRDTLVDMNVLGVAGNKIGTVNGQIALSHTYGNGRDVSCNNVINSVKSLLEGAKVTHYISMEMDAVAIINDHLGGVEVEVLDDFSGIDDTLVKGETVTLMGEHALTYIRSRKGMDNATNAARMKRQQQYINAMTDKLQDRIASDDEFVVDVMLDLSDYIVSDRSVNQMEALAEKFNTYEFLGIRNIEGTSTVGEQGFVEFRPDQDALKALIIECFYKPQN